MESFKNKLSRDFENIVADQCKKVNNPIFIVSGLTDYVDFFKYEDHIADLNTFDEDGNSDFFDRQWFFQIFTKLGSATDYLIVSHQQYAYIIENLNAEFFVGRAIMVYDNLRSLYPLLKDDYIERTSEDGLELRPEGMPVYQSEQFKIGDKYYYSIRNIDECVKKIPFFKTEKQISLANFNYANESVVDIATNAYAIDYFINDCISKNDFSGKYVIKTYSKQPLGQDIEQELRLANNLLSISGGGIFFQHEESVKKDYTPSNDALRLLRQYWGDNADFRHINVYDNPDYGNQVTPISQGLIVDTIIDEFDVGHSGLTPRDVFITAPTGAGKSLLFQIPAFYAAEKGDLTIVVSPLKALMTDQVANLKGERGYNKVAFINSDLNFIDRESIIKQCKDGEIDILYLSPESLLSYDIRFFIGERKLGLLIIDEAHLITTWGRDFRVDYWFLGNHINKIRKFGNYTFPLVALTATAVYGGTNDMVFDSISSLYMHDPHKYIGEVRRNDIEFVIDTHDDYSSGSYDSNKEDETVKFIRGVKDLDCKTIVYAPYTRHIDRISAKANEDPDTVVTYHGRMSADEQKGMYMAFRTNQSKIMVCTKAFGMGIDIPDIQCVYHHAPSGLLPDYVQEIGRAARRKDIHGFAALTFSPSDLRYSKQLFGMSSLKTFQLRAVLQKIHNCFVANGRKRNMLISANDFAYIFDMNGDVNQKVSTALMMIEKDYLVKTRFNVLIARPKSLFSQVFARVTNIGLERLNEQYSDCVKELWAKGEFHYIQLNLDRIWTRHFSDISFPRIKSQFYKQTFLSNQGIDLTPLLKMTFYLEKSLVEVRTIIDKVLNAVASVLSSYNRQRAFFNEKDFREQLDNNLGKSTNVEKLASFILATYSGKVIGNGMLEGDAFLQRRKVGFNEEYQVFNANYEAKFAQLRNRLSKLFKGNESESHRYVSLRETSLLNYMRLGALFEILNVGTFVSQGGEDPKIFIRINDPRKIKKDSEDKNYSNFILESVKNRHKSSCQIFEHFFTRYLDNENRWDMIEDFFLGTSTDDLLSKYEGGTRNRIDILKHIADNINLYQDPSKEINSLEYLLEFKIRPGEYYSPDNLITLGQRTMKLSKWVTEDPVLLHRNIVMHGIQIDKEYYKVLMSKLMVNHKDYYRDFMGLKLRIDFPKYGMVMASMPYNTDPVNFYKWWKTHSHDVSLTKDEILTLFLNVERNNPKALLKKHRQMIGK